jgi:hypothetical protein
VTADADLTTRIIGAAIDHWPLVAGILVAGYWVFPRMLKQVLLNGGGDTIRGIVSTENAKQTVLHAEETRKIVNEAIQQHEKVEAMDRREAFARFEADITDRYDLKRRRKER